MSDLEVVLAALRGDADETEIICHAAADAGDEIHGVLKRQSVAMPSVRAALAVSVHVTAQMLCEVLQFGAKSVDEDGETVKRAVLRLFAELMEVQEPGALAAAIRTMH
ncbi:MAG: hypothetical protein QOH04_2615 [Sphingomonadales bacterium]|jgi:hypothetical protein|nr:hypothetical protein [Sphingomonadales bacterium]